MLTRAMLTLAPALLGAAAFGQEVVWTRQGTPPPNLAVLTTPYVVGDVDVDGYDDLMLGVIGTYPASNQLWTLSGKDGSTLSVWPTAAAGYPYAAAGDVDGDGRPDYVTGGGGANGIQFLEVHSCVDNRFIWQVSGVAANWYGSAIDGRACLPSPHG